MSIQSFYFGGDVSKGYCDFLVLDQNEDSVEENFQLDDTAQGHRVLSEVIKKFLGPNVIIYVGFEYTGGYESNWYHFILKLAEKLNTQNLLVTRLNPKAVHNHKKALLKQITTDKESALVIAHYLIAFKKKIVYQCRPPMGQQDLEDAQNQFKFIQTLKKQGTQFRNKLHSLLYKAHPQLLPHCRDGMSDWLLRLVVKYPSSNRLAEASVEEVSKIKYLRTHKVPGLIECAKNSVASSDSQLAHSTISDIAAYILSLGTMIDKHIRILSLTPTIQSFEQEIKRLMSFQGISYYSAYGLMLLIVAIQRFPTVDAFCAFYGVHPIKIESGDKIGQSRMSKNGPSQMRAILFMITQTAIQKDLRMKALYEKYTEAKNCKMSAIGIMMHKILRTIYGMLKHKTKYDPMVDEKNQRNSAKNKENKKPDTNRRFQKHDENAPISGRQAKKRGLLKEEKEDHPKGKITKIHYNTGSIKISQEVSNSFWTISSYST